MAGLQYTMKLRSTTMLIVPSEIWCTLKLVFALDQQMISNVIFTKYKVQTSLNICSSST